MARGSNSDASHPWKSSRWSYGGTEAMCSGSWRETKLKLLQRCKNRHSGCWTKSGKLFWLEPIKSPRDQAASPGV
uniref:Uncharacterized protein n=1 Tax=Arundo donax TaxID=35708 RepID=A0A0A9FS11_ARUDO